MEHNEIELRNLYETNLPLYERASKNMVDALNIFINENNISLLAVYSRIKTFSSFYDKTINKQYKNPFNDNEDFCGTRIILYKLEDIEIVKSIIETEFDVEKNEKKEDTLDASEFGYRSEHFIVKFKKSWLSTPNYRGLESIKIEIQVRTILMHAWAEIEHKLGYKNKNEVPKELKRKLFMISAKLEDADDQFQELNDKIITYQNNLLSKAAKSGKFTSNDFNLNTLESMLDHYFPDNPSHSGMSNDLFQNIINHNIKLEELVVFAEKIKPHLSFLESLIHPNNPKIKTSKPNIMTYAIEALFEEKFLSGASKSRKNIINQLKSKIQ